MKTPEERKASKKAYLKVYSVKAEVKARRNALRATPEAKAKRKIYNKGYNARPEIIAYHKAYNSKPESKNNALIKNHNMPLEQYNKIYDAQNGCCDICKRPQSEFKKAFAVDHDNITGENRGLLCSNCNSAIGLLNHNIETLNSATQYLNKYDTGHLILRRIINRRLKIQELIKSSLEKIN
jgi:hypothetical protein